MNNPDRASHEVYLVQGSVSSLLKLLMPKTPPTYAAVEQLTNAPLEIRRKFLREHAAFLGARACNTNKDSATLAIESLVLAIQNPLGKTYTPDEKREKQYAWLAADDRLSDADMIAHAYPRAEPALDVHLQRMVDEYARSPRPGPTTSPPDIPR